MIRPYLPLNNLRSFEAAARHLSFTKAAIELGVTAAALSHQVKALEERLGVALFHRHSRGLALTDEGQALLPVLRESFDRMADLLSRFDPDGDREIVSVGCVGTFALGWLLPRLDAFRAKHPRVDVRVTTNNNRVDIAEEGLDLAIRYGDGAWHSTEARRLIEAPLTPLCRPEIAEQLRTPADLLDQVLLRSYRAGEWPDWLGLAGVTPPPLAGPVFDSALAMVEAALAGHGVALAPPVMFDSAIAAGRLVRPFAIELDGNAYWLTRLKGRAPTEAMQAFEAWAARETGVR